MRGDFDEDEEEDDDGEYCSDCDNPREACECLTEDEDDEDDDFVEDDENE